MISALVAVDPTSEKGKSFERFSAVVRLFQQKEILSRTSIVSAIHASLYAVPFSWYREMKGKFAKEALEAIERACTGYFDFDGAKVLQSDVSSNEGLVSKLASYGRRNGHDLLVVSSNERTGLPHWILGSFSETAALTAAMSVLVIKPHLAEAEFPSEVRIVVTVDAAAPPSNKALQWIGKLAKSAGALVHLVYVEPRQRPLVDSLQKRQPKNLAEGILKGISHELRKAGVRSTIEILSESKSIAHTIVSLVEVQKAWLTITISAERSSLRKLLLGSTARRILSLTERPFLSLRIG